MTVQRIVDADTLVHGFSAGKGAAGTVVALLVERGELGYDTPVTEPIALPAVPSMKLSATTWPGRSASKATTGCMPMAGHPAAVWLSAEADAPAVVAAGLITAWTRRESETAGLTATEWPDRPKVSRSNSTCP